MTTHLYISSIVAKAGLALCGLAMLGFAGTANAQGYPQPHPDPYEQARIERQRAQAGLPPANPQQAAKQQQRQSKIDFDLFAGAGISGVVLAEDPGYTTEIGANAYVTWQIQFNNPRSAFVLGVEANYQHLGEFDAFYGPLTTQSFGLSLRPGFTFDDRLTVYGRVGAHYWDLEYQLTRYSINSTHTDNGTDIMYGAGVELNFNRFVGMRGEWTEYWLYDERFYAAGTVSLYYRFF